MAKRRSDGEVSADAVPSDGSAPVADPSIQTDHSVNGTAVASRRPTRRKQGTATERSYWITGRLQSDDPWDRIMCFGTIGRARKGLLLVRTMPHYKRHALRIERCVVVG